MKKPLPPVFFLLAVVSMVALHFLAPIERYWSFPAALVGVVPLVIGTALNVASDQLFIRHRTTIKPFEKSTVLVTTFPFSITRNPMYVGITLMLLGIALLLGTLSPLVPAVIFPIIMDRQFIGAEERMLAIEFGDEWERYRERVRRWL